MNKHVTRASAVLGSAALVAAAAVVSAAGPESANAAGPQRPTAAQPRTLTKAKKPPPPTVASTIIRCEKDSSGRVSPLYDGPSASYLYDRRFRLGPSLPTDELSHHTPQGVAYWTNWNKKGDDLLLVSAHGSSGAHLMGLNPRTSEVVGIVNLGSTHAGALGINSEWLFVNGPNAGDRYTVRAYDLDTVRAQMKAPTDKPLHFEATTEIYGASFLTVEGRKLYAGRYNFDGPYRDWMYRYTIKDNGTLKVDRKPGTERGLRWEIPAHTQGVAKAGNKFLFSTSSGRKKRSNLYVTNASQTNLDKASPRCFRAPSMAQGITVAPGRKVYLNFESGSYEFDGSSSGGRARNVISRVHTADLGTLTGIPGGTLRLGTLHSKNQEDVFGKDEIAIYVEGTKLGKTIGIKQGQRKRINKTIQFTGNARIKLYEKDSPDPDDYLGQHKLKPGKDKGILSFKRRGVHYRLSYSVR